MGDGVRKIIFMDARGESYDRENEDLDHLDALLSTQETQPLLLTFLDDGPNAPGDGQQPELYENQLGPEDLESCLRQAEWDRALEMLTLMVLEGQAVATGVDTVHDESLDIIRAHPELVLRLRGQSCFDLIAKGESVRANAYYRNQIVGVFPDRVSTGHEFVDTLLEDIKAMAQGAEPPSGEDHFADTNKTRRSVNDYLKIYFPDFRHVEEEEGGMPVGLFGEKEGNGVRCLACHKVFNRYTPAKLRFHQLRDLSGRQALCPASTEYIRQQLRKAQQDGSSSSRRRGAETEAEAAALPPPPPPDAEQEPPTSTPHLPPPPPTDDAGPSGATTETEAAQAPPPEVEHHDGDGETGAQTPPAGGSSTTD